MEFVFKRGTTWAILLDDVAGTVASDVEAVIADLRPGTVAPARPLAAQPKVASFTVEARAAAGDEPGGWTLTLSAEATDTLALGSYVVDARLVFDGGTEMVTEPLPIRVIEPATVRADG